MVAWMAAIAWRYMKQDIKGDRLTAPTRLSGDPIHVRDGDSTRRASDVFWLSKPKYVQKTLPKFKSKND